MEVAYTAGKAVLTLFWWTKPAIAKADVKEAPPKFEKDIEPFSLIVDLAVASFLPDNSRPALKNHHIVFDLPSELSVGPVSIDTQGPVRTWENFKGAAIATRDVVRLWDETIQKAVILYPPTKAGNEVEHKIYEMALAGAIKVKRTYERLREQEKSNDTTPELLIACIKTIRDALEREPQEVELSEMTQKVGALWTKSRITTINEMFDECASAQGETHPNDKIKCWAQLKAINSAVEERCQKFESILQEAHKY